MGGSIKHRLDVGRIEFLDHLHARATVLGDLVDVGPLHQPKADVGMAQTVCRAHLPVTVGLQALLSKNGV
jgi:hypothetical protein